MIWTLQLHSRERLHSSCAAEHSGVASTRSAATYKLQATNACRATSPAAAAPHELADSWRQEVRVKFPDGRSCGSRHRQQIVTSHHSMSSYGAGHPTPQIVLCVCLYSTGTLCATCAWNERNAHSCTTLHHRPNSWSCRAPSHAPSRLHRPAASALSVNGSKAM